MRRKVVIITAILSPEASKMKNKEIEAAITLYLMAEDIPFCEKIEKVEILSS